jgi:hypothetical protein
MNDDLIRAARHAARAPCPAASSRVGGGSPIGALSTRASIQPERSAGRKTGEIPPRLCWGGRCSVSLPSHARCSEIGAGLEASALQGTWPSASRALTRTGGIETERGAKLP